MPSTRPEGSTVVRRALALALAAALTIAAAVACAALLTGSWDDTDWRVIGTTAAFSLFSGLAASGAAARLRGWRGSGVVGIATIVCAGVASVIATIGLWTADWDLPDAVWRVCGLAALAAVVLSHACVVNNARRADDSQAISALVSGSIGLAVLDAIGPALAIVGSIDDIGDAKARVLAVLLVLLLLTTALPPVLRRVGATAAPAPRDPAAAAFGAPSRATNGAGATLADEVLASVARLERMGLGPEAAAELDRLRGAAVRERETALR